MVTIAYNLIFLFVLGFAVGFVGGGLILAYYVVTNKMTLTEATKRCVGAGLLAGLVVSIGWSLLSGPSSVWISSPGDWGKEIITAPLNPWQPK